MQKVTRRLGLTGTNNYVHVREQNTTNLVHRIRKTFSRDGFGVSDYPSK